MVQPGIILPVGNLRLMPEGVRVGVARQGQFHQRSLVVPPFQPVPQFQRGDSDNADINADGLPLTGHLLRDGHLHRVVGGEQSEGKALFSFYPDFATWRQYPASAVQQRAGPLRVILVVTDTFVIGPRPGQDGAMGHDGLSFQHTFYQSLPVQTVEERLSDFLLLEKG